MTTNEETKFRMLLERDRTNKLNTWKTYDRTKQCVEFAIANGIEYDDERTTKYVNEQRENQIKLGKW